MSWPAACASGPSWPQPVMRPYTEPRVAGEAVVGPQPEPLGHAGPVPLDQRVGLLDDAQHRLHPVGVLEVDADRASPPPVEDEPARTARRRRQSRRARPARPPRPCRRATCPRTGRARCRSARPPSLRAADPRAQPLRCAARCDVAPAQCHPRAHRADYRVVGSRFTCTASHGHERPVRHQQAVMRRALTSTSRSDGLPSHQLAYSARICATVIGDLHQTTFCATSS